MDWRHPDISKASNVNSKDSFDLKCMPQTVCVNKYVLYDLYVKFSLCYLVNQWI